MGCLKCLNFPNLIQNLDTNAFSVNVGKKYLPKLPLFFTFSVVFITQLCYSLANIRLQAHYAPEAAVRPSVCLSLYPGVHKFSILGDS